MAEERFIDDDKDRKYRIRKNEQGEEELEIVDPEAEQEEFDETYNSFEVPEFEEDDEEAVNLTPEQLYLNRKKREEEHEESLEKAAELYEKACALKEDGQEDYALVTLDTAQKTAPEEWRVYPMQLELISKSFTDFSRLDECMDVLEGFTGYVPEEVRTEFSQKYSRAVEAELSVARAECDRIGAQNEEGKQERRQKFMAQRKSALIHLLYAAVPFIIFLCLGIGFSTIMFSISTSEYVVLTIIFFSLAAVALIACIVLLRPIARAINRLRVNQSNLSTALGRQYAQCKERADKLEELYTAVHYTAEE